MSKIIFFNPYTIIVNKYLNYRPLKRSLCLVGGTAVRNVCTTQCSKGRSAATDCGKSCCFPKEEFPSLRIQSLGANIKYVTNFVMSYSEQESVCRGGGGDKFSISFHRILTWKLLNFRNKIKFTIKARNRCCYTWFFILNHVQSCLSFHTNKYPVSVNICINQSIIILCQFNIYIVINKMQGFRLCMGKVILSIKI